MSEVQCVEGGWNGATEQAIADILGMTPDHVAREGLDMDLFDCARWLADNKIDVTDRAAVRQVFSKPPQMTSITMDQWVDAVMLAAKNISFA